MRMDYFAKRVAVSEATNRADKTLTLSELVAAMRQREDLSLEIAARAFHVAETGYRAGK